MDVAAYLRAARGLRFVSQRDLAQLARVPRSTLDRIEAGTTDPRLSTLVRLFAALGFELLVCNPPGRPLRIDELRETLIDGRERRFPPHWEYERVRAYEEYWGLMRRKVRRGIPEYTYWYRYPARLPLWEDAT